MAINHSKCLGADLTAPVKLFSYTLPAEIRMQVTASDEAEGRAIINAILGGGKFIRSDRTGRAFAVRLTAKKVSSKRELK